MGNRSSSNQIVNNQNTYLITGSNNGLSTGDSGNGSAESKSTLDVRPETNVNWQNGVNPQPSVFIKDKIRGLAAVKSSVGTGFLESVRHGVAALTSLAGNDSKLAKNAKTFVEAFTRGVNEKAVIEGNVQVTPTETSSLATIAEGIMTLSPKVSKMYQTVSLGLSGVRNQYVNTKVTPTAMEALQLRANDNERMNETQILDTVGPRLGIIPDNVQVCPPSDYISTTVKNVRTPYGPVYEIEEAGKRASSALNRYVIPALHATGEMLVASGFIPLRSFHSNVVQGILKQVPFPTKSTPYPNGYSVNSSSVYTLNGSASVATTDQKVEWLSTSTYAYSQPFDDPSREVTILVKGQLTIINQPYDEVTPVRVGFLVKDKNTSQFVVYPCHFINTTEAPATIKPKVKTDSPRIGQMMYSDSSYLNTSASFSSFSQDHLTYPTTPSPDQPSFTMSTLGNVPTIYEQAPGPKIRDVEVFDPQYVNLNKHKDIFRSERSVESPSSPDLTESTSPKISKIESEDTVSDGSSGTPPPKKTESEKQDPGTGFNYSDPGQMQKQITQLSNDLMAIRADILNNKDSIRNILARVQGNAPDVVGRTYSYTSQYECTVNLATTVPFFADEILTGELGSYSRKEAVKAVIVFIHPKNVTMHMAVESPSVFIVDIELPKTMRYCGNWVESGKRVLSFLGNQPSNFSTEDKQEVSKIYYHFISYIIPFLGPIAKAHSESTGASFESSVDIVQACCMESGINFEAIPDIRVYISKLIVSIPTWMSDKSPIAVYTPACRERLFIRFAETVVPQMIFDVDIYATLTGKLQDKYLEDVEKYNAFCKKIDKIRISIAKGEKVVVTKKALSSTLEGYKALAQSSIYSSSLSDGVYAPYS